MSDIPQTTGVAHNAEDSFYSTSIKSETGNISTEMFYTPTSNSSPDHDFTSLQTQRKTDMMAGALTRAAECGRTSEVLHLLEASVDPNVTHHFRRTALHQAARSGHVDIVAALLQAGAGVDPRDSFGETPMHYASSRGHTEVVAMLLRHGASVWTIGLQTQWTALHCAAVRGHTECVSLLLEAGSDSSVRDGWGMTPLDLASTDVVRQMLPSSSKKKS